MTRLKHFSICTYDANNKGADQTANAYGDRNLWCSNRHKAGFLMLRLIFYTIALCFLILINPFKRIIDILTHFKSFKIPYLTLLFNLT